MEWKDRILIIAAAVGGTMAQILGGWDAALQVLICFMGADYMTGLGTGLFRRSGKTESGGLSSQAGFRGLVRKCAMLVLVLLGALLDRATGNSCIRDGLCLFLIANEGLSILENLGLMGVPYPRFLRNILEALKDKGDSPKGATQPKEKGR